MSRLIAWLALLASAPAVAWKYIREIGIAVQGAPPKIAELYSDFRTVEGLRVPFRTAISQAGRLMTTGVVLDVKWNQGLTPEKLGER